MCVCVCTYTCIYVSMSFSLFCFSIISFSIQFLTNKFLANYPSFAIFLYSVYRNKLVCLFRFSPLDVMFVFRIFGFHFKVFLHLVFSSQTKQKSSFRISKAQTIIPPPSLTTLHFSHVRFFKNLNRCIYFYLCKAVNMTQCWF